MEFNCSKQWKHEFVKYVKYAMKTNVQNLVNNKSTRTTCCSGVFIKNFKGVGIKFNIYDGPFFQFDGKKLKFSTGF